MPKAKTAPPKLIPKVAFLHVINEHRWLAASACFWTVLGPSAPPTLKRKADRLFPNIDVMILDSLLMHARSLINFYTNHEHGTTDIVLRMFGLSIATPLSEQLAKYRKPIEVHVLHMTDWRDVQQRNTHSIDTSAARAPTGTARRLRFSGCCSRR